MADPSKYNLKVTGGPNYTEQSPIRVNTSIPLDVKTEQIDARIYVRVQDFRGEGSPATCSYFKHATHTSDRYSISFTFVPKSDISGDDLVFGNDFDHPIRDRLPPLFDKAFSIVKGWIDPGLYGDPYADEPYLYGPLLSSVNTLRIGTKAGEKDGQIAPVEAEETEDSGPIVDEGAEGEEAESIRRDQQMPAAHAQRMKFFLDESHRKGFTFEAGRTYAFDFYNPYLDFNEFALRLPMGFKLHILGSWDGQPLRTHTLRYVLRNRKTNELLFVVNFALIPIDGEAQEALVEDAKSAAGKDGTEDATNIANADDDVD